MENLYIAWTSAILEDGQKLFRAKSGQQVGLTMNHYYYFDFENGT